MRLMPLALAAMLMLNGCSDSGQVPVTKPVEVAVVTIKAQQLPVENELSGRTRAYMTSEVRPQVGGILRKRLFTEGAEVKKDDVLYEIDPASYRAAYNSAKGALAQAEATVLSARPKAERYRKLLALDAVSKQDRDDALASLKQADAAVVAAKADLDAARINLDYTKIRAPISGRIGTSTYTPGALVTADQTTALATINQLDPIYVDVTQSSAQLLHMRRQLKVGTLTSVAGKVPVSLVLEDNSHYAHQGLLEVVVSEVDESTGTVKLRAVVPNPDQELLPGMYVKMLLSMAVNDQAILVPQQAVSRNSKGEATVLVVDGEGRVQLRVVQTDQAVGTRWVVSSGLKAGERVIVEGAQKAKNGDVVRTVDFKQDAGSQGEAGQSALKSAPAVEPVNQAKVR